MKVFHSDAVAGADVGPRLNDQLAQAGLPRLDSGTTERFRLYLSLILKWNTRTNLTGIRDIDGILARHFVESIACAHAIPAEVNTLLDFGSGAGFPGVPISLLRPAIAVTLAESHGKKAAFLQEVVRSLGIGAKVHHGRAEVSNAQFDCVTLRAVERMPEAVKAAAGLVRVGGYLIIMASADNAAALKASAGTFFAWAETLASPGTERGVIELGRRTPNS